MSGDNPAATIAAINRFFSNLMTKLSGKLDADSPAVSADKLTAPFNVTVQGDADASGTTDGSSPLVLSLSLKNTGVSAGAYNNNSGQVLPINVDSKGRITGFGTPIAITTAWGNVSNKPTTVDGYGITDAVKSLNPAFTGLIGARLPSGATADRGAGEIGRVRYNTSTGKFEGFGSDGFIELSNVLLASYAGNVGIASGTTLIAYGNASPAIANGTELWNRTITPTLVGSTNKVRFDTVVDSGSNSRYVTLALFRDNTLIGWTTTFISTANRPQPVSIAVNDQNTSTTPVKYSCRIGINNSATWYVGRGSTNTMGSVNNGAWSIDEVLQ